MDPVGRWRALTCLAILGCSALVKSSEVQLLRVPEDLRGQVAEALALEQQLSNHKVEAGARCNSSLGGPACPASRYRGPTASCNNVRHPQWGARGDIFLRQLPPNYDDGVSVARGEPGVPAAVTLVRNMRALASASGARHELVTSLLPAWGLYLLDDLAMPLTTPNSQGCQAGDEKCNYVRSAPSRDHDICGFDHREQMNIATGYVDGSALYGTTDDEMRAIRLHTGGLIDVSACPRCAEAGAVGTVYRVLAQTHNLLARTLDSQGQARSDQALFLEARRVLAALIQHITYSEFLPVLLGEVGMARGDLALRPLGYAHKYSSAIRAGTHAELLALHPLFDAMIPDHLINGSRRLAEVVGTGAQSAWQWREGAKHWVDRARDHGLPSYMRAVASCDPLASVNSYADFKQLGFTPAQIELFASLYKKPEDVELMVGGAMEQGASGAVVGHTLACILARQFTSLKKSDKFWYENELPPSSLTGGQLAAVRRVTLAGLLCAAEPALASIQPRAFVSEDPYLNAGQLCGQHPQLDMGAWRDEAQTSPGAESGVEATTGAPEVLNAELLQAALDKARREMAERKRLEYTLWEMNGGADPKSPVGTAASFSKANKYALKLANSSLFFEFATNEILNSLHSGSRRRRRQILDGDNSQFAEALQAVDVSGFISSGLPPQGPAFEEGCDDTGPCDPDSPFRTYTGYCNNLRNPNLGKSLTTFARLLPPVYEDGVSHPRRLGVTGSELPSPRVVSTVIHPDISNLHTRYTMMVMQFAQFLDHELTMTPIHKGFHESIPDCRRCDSSKTVHPECNPIPLPRGDHYYPEVNVTSGERLCFPFMRSLPGQQQLGPREQVNQNSAFIDMSAVYGENPCIVRKLRGFNGRLNATEGLIPGGKELLPRSDSHPECKAPSGYCFIAGDGRASEQPALTAMHTMFLREHNRLVEGLRGVNPHWDADLLFEHARRIHTAEFSHIIYNEFLPRLLSWNAVNLYGLKLLPAGYYQEYSSTCNPAIVTEFAAAAFRIGHSLLRPHLPRMSPTYQPLEPPILLRDGFFKTDMFLRPSMTEELIRGLISTPMETLDQFITGEVTNHLFEDRKIPFSGIDLVALNLQRARDHGIPSYNNYRALCNLKRAVTFEDLAREIPDEVIARLKRIYATVDDIDLFPGGMSERPLQGGLVGPTFACIIAIQFRQIRKCDRYWYENDNPAARFSERQLAEIRKATLSKVLCENFDVASDIQRAALDLPNNFLNPRVPCSSLAGIDLSAWRESATQGCAVGGKTLALGESAFPSPCTSCICTGEGAHCASLRITDCGQLFREWPRAAILQDDVCAAQCPPPPLPPPQRRNVRGPRLPLNPFL